MIVAGASFDVGTDDFQVCGADDLTQARKDFLTINKIYILCALQQELLMKYLPLDLIPDYIFERTLNPFVACGRRGGNVAAFAPSFN